MSGARPPYATKSIAESIAESAGEASPAVTFDRFDHVRGPFFHGTRNTFATGDLVVAGHASNYHPGRVSNHVYFSSLIEPAVWAAELAVALSGLDGPGRIYVVEPTGPFEDDPNVTDKRFPGNVTQLYRTREPLRVIDDLTSWDPHPPEVLHTMLDNLARLRAQGLDLIED
jgi:hypothetical protein